MWICMGLCKRWASEVFPSFICILSIFFPVSPFATSGENAEVDKPFPYIVKGMYCSTPSIQGIVFKRTVTETFCLFLQCCLSLH